MMTTRIKYYKTLFFWDLLIIKMHSQLQQNICVVKSEGQIVTESVVMSQLQVEQWRVSNVLQDEEGQS